MNQLTPQQIEQLKKFEELKKVVMNKILSKEAIERLGRVRLVKPELAMQLELYLTQLYQSGQIKTIIDDKKLKQILNSVVKKKDFKIIR
jgi:programmed cell death protein 5